VRAPEASPEPDFEDPPEPDFEGASEPSSGSSRVVVSVDAEFASLPGFQVGVRSETGFYLQCGGSGRVRSRGGDGRHAVELNRKHAEVCTVTMGGRSKELRPTTDGQYFSCGLEAGSIRCDQP